MTKKQTLQQKHIQDELHLSHAQIVVLIRIGGKGGTTGGNAGIVLERKGLVTPWYRDGRDPSIFHERQLTDAGREMLRRARALGY